MEKMFSIVRYNIILQTARRKQKTLLDVTKTIQEFCEREKMVKSQLKTDYCIYNSIAGCFVFYLKVLTTARLWRLIVL